MKLTQWYVVFVRIYTSNGSVLRPRYRLQISKTGLTGQIGVEKLNLLYLISASERLIGLLGQTIAKSLLKLSLLVTLCRMPSCVRYRKLNFSWPNLDAPFVTSLIVEGHTL